MSTTPHTCNLCDAPTKNILCARCWELNCRVKGDHQTQALIRDLVAELKKQRDARNVALSTLAIDAKHYAQTGEGLPFLQESIKTAQELLNTV